MEGGKQIGVLILTAVALIVGVILLQASSQQVGDVINTRAYGNTSLAVVVNGTPQYITTCRALSNVIIWNATDADGFTTNGSAIAAANYTLTNNVVYNGGLSVRILPNADALSKNAWKVQGTCQPTTYDDSSGGRAIAGIIIILFAIALAVVALYPTMKESMGFR